MGKRKRWLVIIVSTLEFWVLQAHAEVPLSTACQTAFGVCPAPVAPVGTLCRCVGPRGPDPGRMIYGTKYPATGSANQRVPVSNACATNFGVCSLPFQAPLGAPCTCTGVRGADVGRAVGGAR